jgi:uncharacterized protein YbjT (DUF2867 family)
VEWRVCDLLRPETLSAAFAGVNLAYYLVHSMGAGSSDFREQERRSARAFAEALASQGKVTTRRGECEQGDVEVIPAGNHVRSSKRQREQGIP